MKLHAAPGGTSESTPRHVVSSLIEGATISPESLVEILGRLLASSPDGVVIQTHYGNQVLNVTEAWEAEGKIHIAVELPANP